MEDRQAMVSRIYRMERRKARSSISRSIQLLPSNRTLAKQYGRYGYRRVTALLHAAGWSQRYRTRYRTDR